MLKCGGGLALNSVQEEVKRLREAPALLDNSGARDSRANGTAETEVQALGEQVRVVKIGFETRSGIGVQAYPVPGLDD